MKHLTITLILLFFLPFIIYAGQSNSYILENGKPVYTDTISVHMSHDAALYKLYYWLNNTYLPQKGFFLTRLSTKNRTVCQVSELLPIKEGKWSSFDMYIRFTMSFDLIDQDQSYVIKVYDINYIEPNDVSALGKFDQGDIIPASFILVDKKYKAGLFIKDGSALILEATNSWMGQLFQTIHAVLRL